MGSVNVARFIGLKAKVKAECLRRNQSGSVAAYGGASYDYTVTPAVGGSIKQEHRDKLTGPMSAINSNIIPPTSGAGTVKDSELSAMETRVAAWSTRSITDRTGSDCKSGCTGTCYTGCNTGCYTSCSGGCTGCGSGCPNGCSSCGGACSNNCSGDCDGCSGCGSSCSYDCGGCTGCSGGCKGSCSGSCDTGCKGCDGCTATCASRCMNRCVENS